jgi:hypothetical protein
MKLPQRTTAISSLPLSNGAILLYLMKPPDFQINDYPSSSKKPTQKRQTIKQQGNRPYDI